MRFLIPRSARTLVAQCLALLFLASLPIGDASAEDLVITGRGTATYTKKKEAMAAREAAIQDALRDCVRKGLRQFVAADVLSSNARVIESDILPIAAALVVSHSIVTENELNKTYEIVLKATLDTDELRANLESVGISQDGGSWRSVAGLIEEYAQDDVSPSDDPIVAETIDVHAVDSIEYQSIDAESHTDVDARASESGRSSRRGDSVSVSSSAGYGWLGASATDRASASRSASNSSHSASADFSDHSSASYDEEYLDEYHEFSSSITRYFPPQSLKHPRPEAVSANAITGRLIDRDVRMVEPDVLQDVRDDLVGPDGVLLASLSSRSLSNQALELGAKHGFDAMMVGVTIITRDDSQEGRGTNLATARLAVQIVDTATGDIIAAKVSQQRGKGTTFTQASDDSAERLGDILGQELGEQLFEYWKRRDDKGFEVTVRFRSTQLDSALKVEIYDTLSRVRGIEDLQERVYDRENGIVEFVLTTREPLTEMKNDLIRAFVRESALASIEEEMSVGTNWNFSL